MKAFAVATIKVIKRLPGKQATAWSFFVLFVVGILYLWWDSTQSNQPSNLWDEDGSVRTLIFAIGLAGAFLGAWLATIRNENFAKQVDTQTKQTRSEILSRCIQQIGHEKSPAIRTAGIRGLEFLAQGHQDDALLLEHICGILQGIIDERAPSRGWQPHLSDAEELGFVSLKQELRGVKNVLHWNLGAILKQVNLDAEEIAELKQWDAHWRKNKQEVELAVNAYAYILALGPKTLLGPNLSHRYLPSLNILAQENRNSSLRGAQLNYSFLLNANFQAQDLRDAYCAMANMHHANFFGAKLHSASFSGANLDTANLFLAQSQWANFSTADLTRASLHSANLQSADLQHANLKSANLRAAKLQSARLEVTRLQSAHLVEARLDGAKFYRNSLTGADCDGTHLAGARYYEDGEKYRQDFYDASLGAPPKHGIPITRENGWLKEQGVRNWENAIYSDDPKPDDPKV